MKNLPEKKMIEILSDLKKNHNALSLKVEFEDEGANFSDALMLKKLALMSGLDLTIKIGGCGALNDIKETKAIGVSTIVAPMIESSYALKKFVQRVKSVYENEIPELFINVETITGYNNFDEILSIPELDDISGVVVGRLDLAKSIDLTCKETNSEQIFYMVNELAAKTMRLGKKFVIGGAINSKSLDFFNRLPKQSLTRFETRKVVFEAESFIQKNDKDGILKALEFEIIWTESKVNLDSLELKRLEILKNRYNDIINSKENLVLK